MLCAGFTTWYSFFFFFQQPCSWHIRWYSRSALSWLYSCWNLEEQGPLLLFPLQMGMCLQLSCNGQPENFQGFHYFHSFSLNVEQKLFSGLLKSITSSFIHNLVIHYFGTAWPGDPASSLLTCCLKNLFYFYLYSIRNLCSFFLVCVLTTAPPCRPYASYPYTI